MDILGLGEQLGIHSVMAILSCNSLTKPHQILASSADKLKDSSSPSISRHPGRLKPTRLPAKKDQVKLSKTQEGCKQPSVMEIERAIGAGIFRERDVDSEAGEKTSRFDNVMRNSDGKDEGQGPLEKKLRESGQWLTRQAERASRSAEKQILVAMFVWWIPLWMIAFVVATGFVQIPFLEDLVS